jgi:dihydrofolate reductase
MRKLILKMDISLDGFGAKPDGGLDWAVPRRSDEGRAWIVPVLWNASVHVMGAGAGAMAAYWPTATGELAAAMNEIPKVIFSSTIESVDWNGTTIESGDLATAIDRMKQGEGKPILAHGGPRFACSLSRLGLVDEYLLVQHPIALGEGLPIFDSEIDLDLADVRRFATGAQVLTLTRAG